MSFFIRCEKNAHEDKPLQLAARYYLLDGDFRIISAITGGENDENSSFLFDLFPANRLLREEVDAYVRSYPHEVLLTLCSRTPVLFIGTLLAQAGLILAVVPEGEIKKTLSLPAAFHHVPAQVCVSASAQMRYKAHGEEAFAAACRWLFDASAPFLPFASGQRTLSALLSLSATRLSSLLRVPLSCDFSGLPALSCEGCCTELAVGVILATLMAARRSSLQGEVQLLAVKEEAPTLYLSFSRADTESKLDEFLPLLGITAVRAMALDVVSPKDRPDLVQVRAAIGVVELSAQGLREPNHFLEGKSSLVTLPVAYAPPPSFPEMSFD